MFGSLARKIFGSANDRTVKRLRKDVERINALESQVAALDDAALKARTDQFRERIAKGEDLDDLLPDAFATVREAARRVLGQRHYDVQLIGGMVLNEGKIAEMKTGEGKTLVGTAPVYLNGLSGTGVHVVTVNDYLARRDSAWMGQIYRFLGLSVGCIVHGLTDEERRAAYACDITYGTNNEFGFDYLRDNMKFRREELVQRPFNYAIVDEVDSILIDEARTPLIISGPSHDSSELYLAVDKLMPNLSDGDFEKDEKHRTVALTEEGQEKMEGWLTEADLLKAGGLYDTANISLVHHANQALRAHKLFRKDTDYIVKDDKVVIIDEFTGRMMEGRRYSDGLHQALEAKERVTIQRENQTLASITFQNYFRLYPKLAGMTGTAMTEAGEFAEIYNLEVVEIPTNVQVLRKDADDEVDRPAKEKYDAIVALIEDCQARRQPILVGTVSIEKSEMLADVLKTKKVPHQVLNARFHDQEAAIIAEAGKPGAVTIATNMAGRGTDIQLGGNFDVRFAHAAQGVTDEARLAEIRTAVKAEIERDREIVRQAGGLYVMGTERHESRRIDNQLRGRSGRQGDPGASKFFLSLEDDLMRIFGSQRLDGMLQKLGLQEGEAITHTWISKALEKAQQRVEAHNFEIRKNLLKYDNVMNDQRKVVYEQRREIMDAEDVQGTVEGMRHDVIARVTKTAIPPESYSEQWDLDQLHEEVLRLLALDLPIKEWAKEDGIAEEEIETRIRDASDRKMAEKAANYGPEFMRMAEKSVLLQILDQQWKEHLLALDHLRQGINLRAYAQRDPLNEYKREAFELFEGMLQQLRDTTTSALSHLEVRVMEPPPMGYDPQGAYETREDPALVGAEAGAGGRPQGRAAGGLLAPNPFDVGPSGAPTGLAPARETAPGVDPNDPRTWHRTPRNAACPCGSGKKFKHCHGRI
ncbi:MAG: preprotein translocase subunit SecA [Rhodospirillales bacterium]